MNTGIHHRNETNESPKQIKSPIISMYNPFQRYCIDLCSVKLLSLVPHTGAISSEALSFHHAQTPSCRDDSHASK